MKKVLVSGYIGFDNFGDEAIFYALNCHLQGLGFEVEALCNNPNNLSKNYNIKAYYFKNPFQILKAILNCDVLYSGGGSLLQNKTSNFSLYYYLFIILLAKIFNKKVIIFSQGIEPIQGKIHEFFMKTVLKKVDYITVRDKKSLKYLKTLNLKADLTSDPVYSLVENCKILNSKEGLIIQLRDFKGFNKAFLDDLSNCLKSYKGEIKVLSLQNKQDEEICKTFVEILNSKGYKAKYIPFYSIERIFELINEAKYVISTRLHGVILANALKSKTFALIYDDKVKTLADELNIQNIDLRNYNQNELFVKLSDFFNKEREILPYRKFDWSLTDLKLLKRK